MGESLSSFRSRVGGDEGFVTWRYGDTYWVSLRPWQGMDPELTYMHPVFHRPYDRAAFSGLSCRDLRAIFVTRRRILSSNCHMHYHRKKPHAFWALIARHFTAE
jgi:hypothetical protein